jgi:energy-coupling factor transporter ATP-binding protein EcfA2
MRFAAENTSGETLESRLAYFQSFTVAHPHLVAAKDALIAGIRQSEPNAIVMVFGPTGVGKTTLRMKTEQILIEELRAQLESDRGRIPVASVEAIAPDSGSFCWRSHFKRLLQEMDEPLVDRKRLPARDLDRRFGERFGLTDRSPGSEYRYAVEQTLRHRRPVAVMIDEAQHLAKVASGRRLLDQLDVIKSIANRTDTVHVLFGTYDLLAFRNLNGQLSRRSVDVHFPRYRAEVAEERKTFINIVHSFQKTLPLSEAPDLVKVWDFLYERSLGCVGILKQWLAKALSTALRHGDATISLPTLESHALSAAQCDKILSEVMEGEDRLKDCAERRSTLRARLGLVPLANAPGASERASIQARENNRHKLRPGQRKPVRDPIGQPTTSPHAACL